MTNQKTYLEGIKSKCPYCNHINIGLITYQVYNSPSQKFVGDFIMSEIENELGFLDGYCICDSCNKKYLVIIGIEKNMLTKIVLVDKI